MAVPLPNPITEITLKVDVKNATATLMADSSELTEVAYKVLGGTDATAKAYARTLADFFQDAMNSANAAYEAAVQNQADPEIIEGLNVSRQQAFERLKANSDVLQGEWEG